MRIRLAKMCALFLASLITVTASVAQSTDLNENYWNSSTLQSIESGSSGGIQIESRKADYFQIEFESFYQALLNAENGTEISLPINNGFQHFVLVENSTMSDGLRENFTGINSYNIVSTSSRSVWGKMDVSHNGFHAMIFQPGKSTLYIDPVFHNEPMSYMVYHRSDFVSSKSFECHVTGHDQDNRLGDAKGNPYTECVMNTYRFAVAATGEYTEFQGGELEDALAAQVTTVNRVNMVYERDFGVNLSIIPNNDEIVYLNGNTDPYTNGDAGDMIGQNQTNINSVIGSGNYDVGHVFGTNSGGLAGLGVTCSNNSKARGVTGSSAPINDPFDIDYVAHEVGHQFGGNHTFNNSCSGNRNNDTAVEPGSGTTIMAYAGICAPDIQNNSDDYFHGVSMSEIGDEISNDNCQVVTDTGNSSPVLNELPDEILIPLNTPFILTASATDAEGDTLTYDWEQMDTEISDQPPVQTATGGPNFRSFDPSLDSARYFPDLGIVTTGPYTWQRLPTVAREMNFRVSVRDNAYGGGCTQYDDMVAVFVDNTGPFKVQYPDAISIVWQAYEYETILWDVANTTEAPLNAELVDIYLSLDDGETYDVLIAEDIENDGSHTIEVPNLPTLEAMIMVINSEGTFFDVSNNDFTIEGIDDGFWFESAVIDDIACQSETVSFEFIVNEVGNFSESISLSVTNQPDNSNVSLSQDEAMVGEVVTVTVNGLTATEAGQYSIEVTGTSVDFQNQISFMLTVLADSPDATSLLLPEDESLNIETYATFSWEDNADIGETYSIEISESENFTTIVESASNLDVASYQASALDAETTYFWRVFVQNDCGSSASSQVFSVSTYSCNLVESDFEPIEISESGTSETITELEFTESRIIADLNVVDVIGTHSRISDLEFILESPMGTEVSILAAACGAEATLFPNSFEVTVPSSIAGNYESSEASTFGGDIPTGGITGALVLGDDGSDSPNQLCDEAINPEELNGNIVLLERGGCPFVQKILNAQEAGAAAVVVSNNSPGDGFFTMGGTSTAISIPSAMVSFEDGVTLASGIGLSIAGFDFSFDDESMVQLPCPPIAGGVYTPANPLSVFNGEDSQGIWKLTMTDVVNGEGGVLDSWALQMCYVEDISSNIANASGIEAAIYPNPTSDIVTVALSVQTYANVSLIDISGRVIEEQNIQSQITQFDLSRLSKGIYFIKIASQEYGQSVFKVVRQ